MSRKRKPYSTEDGPFFTDSPSVRESTAWRDQLFTRSERKRARKAGVHMQYTQVLFDVRDSVAFITLNRPEILNAVTLELARDLMNVAMECHDNRKVRAVVLSGAGNAFCAGGDLKSFAAQGERLPAYITE